MATSESFLEKITETARRKRSWLCVGLDPDPALAPRNLLARSDWVNQLCQGIVEVTLDLACAYKPNLAFFEALGNPGWEALSKTLAIIPRDQAVIIDAKRGDIGSTSQAYARSVFEVLKADAVTVSPYLGEDSLSPFFEYPGRGVLVLCRTSNRGAADFQDLPCRLDGQEMPLFQAVARRAVRWATQGSIGLVVGATFPGEIATVRQIAPNSPFLIPGVGAQGGDLEAAVKAGVDAQGELAIVNASRQVMYASRGADWRDAAREAARRLRDEIERARGTGS